jgi:hypothetical protein
LAGENPTDIEAGFVKTIGFSICSADVKRQSNPIEELAFLDFPEKLDMLKKQVFY